MPRPPKRLVSGRWATRGGQLEYAGPPVRQRVERRQQPVHTALGEDPLQPEPLGLEHGPHRWPVRLDEAVVHALDRAGQPAPRGQLGPADPVQPGGRGQPSAVRHRDLGEQCPVRYAEQPVGCLGEPLGRSCRREQIDLYPPARAQERRQLRGDPVPVAAPRNRDPLRPRHPQRSEPEDGLGERTLRARDPGSRDVVGGELDPDHLHIWPWPKVVAYRATAPAT
jgi:hypothetical protein